MEVFLPMGDRGAETVEFAVVAAVVAAVVVMFFPQVREAIIAAAQAIFDELKLFR